MSSEKFKTRARIIKQLGFQLIKNEAIALLELVKNSYDADASFCKVKMEKVDDPKKGVIVIEDDGEGMNDEILRTAWLEIGTSYKEELAADPTTRRTKKFKRLRLGEKGIGRLGVHRLGKLIEIITRRNDKEYVLTIDWDKVESHKYIEDVQMTIVDRKPEVIKDESGTQITIKKLRSAWTKKMARDCYRTITSLNSPFEDMESFKATVSIDKKEWVEDLLDYEDVSSYKLFEFSVLLEGNLIKEFEYKFVPWATMTKLKSREITHNSKEMQSCLRMICKEGKDYRDVNLSDYKIGPILFKGVIFDRDTRTLDLGVQDKSGLKKYLDANGGVRVYRDNMRVLDYGEPGNDWLDLGGRRINIPAKRISNNIVLAAVYLKRAKSDDLKEKASREGFIENEAYDELVRAILYCIDKLETFRKIDKGLLRKYYGPQKIAEPVITSITELKDVVERSVKDNGVQKQIFSYLDRIENEYEYITESLLRSAGAGLNLIVVIHQMEKIIKEVKAGLKKGMTNTTLLLNIESLSSLVEGYSILVKNSEKKVRNMKGIINQAIQNMNFRFDAHKIKIQAAYSKKEKDVEAFCSEDHVLNALMNLFDNSIWWLGYSKTPNPEIYIDISDAFPGYLSIVVADNGPGFSLPTDEIIKPFITGKPRGMGMGIGLHIAHEVMKSLNGMLIFPENEYFEIPERFMKGAIIALAFKRGAK